MNDICQSPSFWHIFRFPRLLKHVWRSGSVSCLYCKDSQHRGCDLGLCLISPQPVGWFAPGLGYWDQNFIFSNLLHCIYKRKNGFFNSQTHPEHFIFVQFSSYVQCRRLSVCVGFFHLGLLQVIKAYFKDTGSKNSKNGPLEVENWVKKCLALGIGKSVTELEITYLASAVAAVVQCSPKPTTAQLLFFLSFFSCP